MTHLIPLYLAAVSRMAGDKYLKWVGVALYPVPYCAIGYTAYNSWIIPACLYAWVFGWKLTGHHDGYKGHGRDNTLTPVAVFVSSFFGIKRDSQEYDAIFWAIKGGIIAAIPAGIIALFTASYIPAIGIFCASFCGYPLAYWLGFNVLHKRLGLVNTAWGETLAGFFAGMGFIVDKF